MNKKKLIKYILLGMWIVYMCVGVYCFIQNENSKDNATTEVQDDNLTVTPTTDSVADKNTPPQKNSPTRSMTRAIRVSIKTMVRMTMRKRQEHTKWAK